MPGAGFCAASSLAAIALGAAYVHELLDRYGEKKLYEGGLSVRATLNPKLQVAARKSLADCHRSSRSFARQRRSVQSRSAGVN